MTPPPAKDPISLYGDRILFDIERNGTPVGSYTVEFTRGPEGLIVDSRATIDVKFLFLSAYSFRYRAKEIWANGQLQLLAASTNDNGEHSYVDATADGSKLRVRSSNESYAAPLVPATTHWNAAQLSSPTLLNTITGRINSVQAVRIGKEEIATRTGKIVADRFSYSGDLAADVWYDDRGRWVKLRFRAKDDSAIEYICRTCPILEAQKGSQ